MKKHLLFLLALTPILVFLSCSSSDEETEKLLSKSEIVGTWVGTDDFLRKDTLVFLNNDECSLSSFYMQETGTGSFKHIDIKLKGVYKVSGTKVSIIWSNKQEFAYKIPKSEWEERNVDYPSATFEQTKYHPAGNGMVYTGESAYHGYSQSYFDKLK